MPSFPLTNQPPPGWLKITNQPLNQGVNQPLTVVKSKSQPTNQPFFTHCSVLKTDSENFEKKRVENIKKRERTRAHVRLLNPKFGLQVGLTPLPKRYRPGNRLTTLPPLFSTPLFSTPSPWSSRVAEQIGKKVRRKPAITLSSSLHTSLLASWQPPGATIGGSGVLSIPRNGI